MCRIVLLSALVLLSGCASIVDGTHQQIAVNTNPPGADCVLNRKSEKEGPELQIARINPTPGRANVEKTKYDITIVCNKLGYQQASQVNHSGNQGSTLGNIVLGGGIGWAVDSARGADNRYDTPVTVTLVPEIIPPVAVQPAVPEVSQPLQPLQAQPPVQQ